MKGCKAGDRGRGLAEWSARLQVAVKHQMEEQAEVVSIVGGCCGARSKIG